jgi:hypothetical protein
MSLANATGYPSDDQAISVAWSPDAKWLAIARWVGTKADGGVAIDGLEIGPAGSASDAGRVSFDAVLSPDETQVAFGRDTDESTWLVDADGKSQARRLSARYGDISWQPIP